MRRPQPTIRTAPARVLWRAFDRLRRERRHRPWHGARSDDMTMMLVLLDLGEELHHRGVPRRELGLYAPGVQ